jgi:uncharacterized membrane protein
MPDKKTHHYYDHHKRSLAKSIGYIALVVLADWIVTFLITMQVDLSIKVTAYSNLVGAVIYFIHERAWNHIHWGRSKIEIDLIEKK